MRMWICGLLICWTSVVYAAKSCYDLRSDQEAAEEMRDSAQEAVDSANSSLAYDKAQLADHKKRKTSEVATWIKTVKASQKTADAAASALSTAKQRLAKVTLMADAQCAKEENE